VINPRTLGFLSFVLFIVAFAIGCSGRPTKVDPSPDAFDSGDYALLNTACGAVPGRGMDACFFTAGSPITSGWNLIAPKGKTIIGAEADVYYRDIHKQYSASSGSVVTIKWADFFGAKAWSKAQDGEVMALLTIKWTDGTGLERVTKYRGIAKIFITAPGYERLPIDSGFSTWGSTCEIEYSDAGRSNLLCH
jgi:hypothetical protein